MFQNNLQRIKHYTMLTTAICCISACGGGNGGYGDSDGPSSTPTPTATPTTTPTATPEPTVTPVAQPIVITATNAGETLVGAGNVETLIASETDESFAKEVSERTGFTLYVRDNDPLGESSCATAGCVSTWPPLLANNDATAEDPLTIIEREDGSMQWALRDKPLYFFSGDELAGDIKGEGKGGFHVALTQPLAIGGNENAGQFFVGFGKTLAAKPIAEGINDSFVSEEINTSGLTLYTFSNDEPGKSNCFNQCAVVWPALLAGPNDVAKAPFSLVERAMNTEGATAMQWAYRGKPLYYFFNDTQPGDTNGLANEAFSLVRPLPWKVADSEIGSLFAGTNIVLTATPDAEANDGTELTSSQGKDGFTLYTLDDDIDSSTCTGACLANWPAFIAHEGAVPAGPFSLIARESGEMQWALNGKPLYFFVNDSEAGDTNGDGIAGKFHAARMAPVATHEHETEGAILIASGKLINKQGEADISFAGFTLYTFVEDSVGSSTCFDQCEDSWPPLFAPANAKDFGDFTVIDRNNPNTQDDDELTIKQWAYKGEPLYFFIGDSSPGDANGEHSTWFIARP